ncbi:MAG TPA: hydrogenase formation protein HypD [Lachnospiraceae bacterium]|nr:hydrogenase formation protein HypD [Lachnospiraceae bacterium]
MTQSGGLNGKSAIEKAREIISTYHGPRIRIMEVCGTHTHEIFRQGIRSLLSEEITLISGPGCPVCVTPVSYIDEAVMLALEKGCTILTFGDLVRVPGSDMSLQTARGEGAKVRVVYSPQDAEVYARTHPEEETVFLSVGFETTTPSSCIALEQAIADGISNFSLLCANKTMPAAYRAMMDATDAYLYPGHVCAIQGLADCRQMLDLGMSGVVAGFTPQELLTALAVIVQKTQEGKPFLVNCYPRVVTEEGSPQARALVEKYMEPCDSMWRGIGTMKDSGMDLRDAYEAYDARKKYHLPKIEGREAKGCRCGEVLQGACTPRDCPLFGRRCTPEHPVGACMVSSEGACSAFYLYDSRKEQA